MKSLLVVLMLICLMAACVLSLPLDLGSSGVYNNPEANLYWASRFPGLGSGFGSLRALQVKELISRQKLLFLNS